MVKIEIKCTACTRNNIIKAGVSSSGIQTYKCKNCSKRFQLEYRYNAYNLDLNDKIMRCMHDGVGVRATARILKIA